MFAESCSVEVAFDTGCFDTAVDVCLVSRLVAVLGVSTSSVYVDSLKMVECEVFP